MRLSFVPEPSWRAVEQFGAALYDAAKERERRERAAALERIASGGSA